MTKQEALNRLFDKTTTIRSLNMAQALFHWDSTTTGVPEKSLSARSTAVGWLSGEQFKRFIAEDTLEAVETLEAEIETLSVLECAMVREYGREYRKKCAVPPEEMEKYSALLAESKPVWETAREKRDFAAVQPYYEKIFDFQRRLCDWYGYEKHPYDALLDDYERGANVEILDGFFGALRKSIVPLIKIAADSEQITMPEAFYDKNKQRELQPWLCNFVGYDMKRGKTGEVEHPYCMTLNRDDVRITTKYHEDNVLSALYSTIHESGHAIYEQNMDAELVKYDICYTPSTGIHESQSRLYENMLGRSKEFVGLLLPKLCERFDVFAGWDEHKLYRAVNAARPSLIRIEADELTYCLHVMVRYELEKDLLDGKIRIAELPELWADKYEELLGVRPNHVSEGVMQDTHWSSGLVGYFPSYAVGNAYAAQLMAAMRKTVNVDSAVASGNLSTVNAWLCENVHRHGAVFSPDELLRKATGKSFDPSDYVAYLTSKFTELYAN